MSFIKNAGKKSCNLYEQIKMMLIKNNDAAKDSYNNCICIFGCFEMKI